jgi:hypothetical protein
MFTARGWWPLANSPGVRTSMTSALPSSHSFSGDCSCGRCSAQPRCPYLYRKPAAAKAAITLPDRMSLLHMRSSLMSLFCSSKDPKWQVHRAPANEALRQKSDRHGTEHDRDGARDHVQAKKHANCDRRREANDTICISHILFHYSSFKRIIGPGRCPARCKQYKKLATGRQLLYHTQYGI